MVKPLKIPEYKESQNRKNALLHELQKLNGVTQMIHDIMHPNVYFFGN